MIWKIGVDSPEFPEVIFTALDYEEFCTTSLDEVVQQFRQICKHLQTFWEFTLILMVLSTILFTYKITTNNYPHQVQIIYLLFCICLPKLLLVLYEKYQSCRLLSIIDLFVNAEHSPTDFVGERVCFSMKQF